jgi:small-conductance mechanosensitive channel
VNDADHPGASEPIVPADSPVNGDNPFFADALHRIRRISLILGVISTVCVWLRFGVAIAAGFVVGCIVSYVNFLWLERVINAVAERMVQTGRPGSARKVVLRFLLRYGLVAVACFVILVCFKSSVYGLLGGLFLTVAAILCEAAYEAVAALRGT